MFLNGLGTAVPPRHFTQMECWAALQKSPQFPQLNARSRALLKKVLSGENGIATRHLAVANLDEMFVLTPDALHARFAENAPALGAQAAERALAHALRQEVYSAIALGGVGAKSVVSAARARGLDVPGRAFGMVLARDFRADAVTAPSALDWRRHPPIQPIFGVDVWEHACYLMHQNRRPDYG